MLLRDTYRFSGCNHRLILLRGIKNHAALGVASGYVAVDVFFVICGYLIAFCVQIASAQLK
jgi:peptidoglycan/LPS O-acetylase OafA/YrhL